MTFNELQKNWGSQQTDLKLTIDPELLLKETKRNKKSFEADVFRRDVREVGVAALLAVVFFYFGNKYNLWPLWLVAILCLWISVFMVVDRIIQKRKQPCLSDSLSDCITSSLVQINHQIWLLRNVLWWYLAPLGTGIVIWFCYCGILVMTSEKPSIVYLLFILVCIVCMILFNVGIYWLNQRAVRKELIPRKQELRELLNSLKNSR